MKRKLHTSGIGAPGLAVAALAMAALVAACEPLPPDGMPRAGLGPDGGAASPADGEPAAPPNGDALPGEVDPGPPPEGLRVRSGGDLTPVRRVPEGGVLLGGGGVDPRGAMRLLVELGQRGDVVVLRMDDTGGAYVDYFLGLGAHSVRELSFDEAFGNDNVSGANLARARALADSPYVDAAVRNAEVIFIAGGNQTKYLDVWQGTALARAVSWATTTKRAAIGGTSAGMHIVAKVVHAPAGSGSSLRSADALADPYLARNEVRGSLGVELAEGPFEVPLMEDVVVDSHLTERDRLGRSVVLLARVLQDGQRPLDRARLIGCDEDAAVVVDGRGVARVFGAREADAAYFIKPESMPDVCSDNTPLEWRDGLTLLRVGATREGRNTVDLRSWQTSAASPQRMSVVGGELQTKVQLP